MNVSETVGKWESILVSIGIDQAFLSGKHTACPCCGGKDRFRFDNKQGKGTFFCTNCGAGDGIRLAENYLGLDFKEVLNKLESMGVGSMNKEAIKPKVDYSQNKRRLNEMHLSSKPYFYGENQDVDEYLKSRGLTFETIKKMRSIRFCEGIRYWDAVSGGYLEGQYTGLLCPIYNQDKKSTYHITYLKGGMKARVPQQRKIMPRTEVPILGGAIKLFDSDDGVLGLAEGVETAASAFQVRGVATWAATSSAAMQKFAIPEWVTEFHIFGDRDKNFVGQANAYILGMKANKIPRLEGKVHVHLPRFNGDFNDEIL